MDLLAGNVLFGKFKGNTWLDMFSTEERIKWLQWYIKQPCSNPNYAQRDAEMKQAVKDRLESMNKTSHIAGVKDTGNDNSQLVLVIVDLQLAVDRLSRKVEQLLGGAGAVAPDEEVVIRPEDIPWEE